MRMKPLVEFVCDDCHELIRQPSEGWLEWLRGDDDRQGEFRIVHHVPASPRAAKRIEGCQYPAPSHVLDVALERVVGHDGLAKLLSMLDRPLGDIGEFLEVIRRLQIPHYEEARLYWQTAEDDGYFLGANEYWPYLQESLKNLIQRFGTGE